MIESSENKIEHDFLCYIVILPLHETSTYVGVVIIRYNNFAAVVYDGSYLFIEIRFMFTIKSHVKKISKRYDLQNHSLRLIDDS